MDEIFRVEKPLATLIWKRRSPSGMRKDPVSVDHEYVLLYAKDRSKIKLSGLMRTASDYPFTDASGKKYASTDLTIGMTAEDRPNQFYDIINPNTDVKYEGNPNRVWRFEPDMMKQIIEKKLVIWPDEAEGEMTRPRYKTYFDPEHPKMKPLSSWVESNNRSRAEIEEEAEDYEIEILTSGMNAEGGRVLQRIFGKKLVEYPKPPSLIRALVRAATTKTDIVLDSFAGSGTSAHAVLELNKEDGGSRKFVLIQQPYDTKDDEKEKLNICEKIAAERVRRIIDGYSYKTPKGKKENVKGLGGSFVYARLTADPILGEYRDITKHPPSYDEIAKYIFFTETSTVWDKTRLNDKTHKIGEYRQASFYLLYSPNQKDDKALDVTFLNNIVAKDKNPTIVIYCEKIWLHRSEILDWSAKHKKNIRPMIVPFNLK
jgi:adenine-specific DNA-methyltransferase